VVSTHFAEILGLLCAEGSHIISYSNYWENDNGKKRYRKNKKSERIEFYSKDEKLSLHYLTLLESEFNYRGKITKHGKVNIGNRNVIRKITEQTPLGHLNWNVPDSIISSCNNRKIAFLRGFFDGDGTAINIVRMFSTNKRGIYQISQLLLDLNYKHTVQKPVIKPNRKPHYVLQLSRKHHARFFKEIKPVIKLPVIKIIKEKIL